MANLPPEPPPDDITPEDVYLRRREFIRNAALAVGGAAVLGGGLVALTRGRGAPEEVVEAPEIPSGARQDFANGEELTAYSGITGYNNFYEFGVDKTDPARFAHMLKPKPWMVEIAGEVGKPGVYDLDDLIGGIPLEDRVYRMRCVEAWSMVIPWLGFPLASLLAKVEPTPAAKYVAFTTLLDPEQMPGQKWGVLDWPYVEGLRIDEAMHPLALLAVGIYGKALLGQNGAPLRLVVPWKYGFKGIKSIVRIALVREQPPTTWNIAAPDEYGFYANVNPEVDHPRWSQASERRIGELIRRPTLPFNGYADAVASLYTGLDLRVNF